MKILLKDKVFVTLLIILFYSIIIYYIVQGQFLPTYGDEGWYLIVSEQFKELFLAFFSGSFSKIPKIWDDIISWGAFNPLMGLICMPVRLFGGELAELRLYLLMLNFVIDIYILKIIYHRVNRLTAIVLCFLFFISPFFNIFSGTLWGESLAGRFYIILLLHLYQLYQFNRGFKDFIWAGIYLGLIIQFRKNTLFLLPATAIAIFCCAMHHSQSLKQWLRYFIPGLGITMLTFYLVMMPWSFSCYQKFGGFYLTSTTAKTSRIGSNISPDFNKKIKNELSPRKRKAIRARRIFYYYSQKGEENQTNFNIEISKDINRLGTEFSMNKHYDLIVNKNFPSYFFSPVTFLDTFKNLSVNNKEYQNINIQRIRAYNGFIRSQIILVWHITLSGGLFLLIIPFTMSNPLGVLLNFSKMFFVSLSLHPFLLLCNPRHGILLYCIMLFMLALFIGVGIRTKEQILSSLLTKRKERFWLLEIAFWGVSFLFVVLFLYLSWY